MRFLKLPASKSFLPVYVNPQAIALVDPFDACPYPVCVVHMISGETVKVAVDGHLLVDHLEGRCTGKQFSDWVQRYVDRIHATTTEE